MPPLIVDVILFGLVLVLRDRDRLKKTARDAEAIAMGLVDGPDAAGQRKAYRGTGSKTFKGPLKTKGIDRFGTVGDLCRSMQLDQFEDAFQAGTSDDDDAVDGPAATAAASDARSAITRVASEPSIPRSATPWGLRLPSRSRPHVEQALLPEARLGWGD